MAHLDPSAAKWQLFEFEEAEDELKEIDLADRGNMKTRLVHNFNQTAVLVRFGAEIERVHQLMPEAEVVALSQAEVAFRCHGLEFARARLAHNSGSLRCDPEIVFGLGAAERILNQDNLELFAQVVRSVGEVRHFDGPRDNLLWRLHPERWLESLALDSLAALDERLDPTIRYSQVPAFSASDRAIIDVLAVTREGRLAVVELKADEDIHLPMQGLDYWSRVAWHHARGEFQRFGYFTSRGLSTEEPLLLLVAPALHVHPATDTLLHYLAPQIDWTVAGIDERWRQEVKVIFRKRPPNWRRARLPVSA
jgi:hypothetical protein